MPSSIPCTAFHPGHEPICRRGCRRETHTRAHSKQRTADNCWGCRSLNFEVLSSRLNLPPPLIRGLSGLALSSSSPFLSLPCHPSFPSLSVFFSDRVRGQELRLQVKNSRRTRRADLTISDREGESLGHTPHKCVPTHAAEYIRYHIAHLQRGHAGIQGLIYSQKRWKRLDGSRVLRAALKTTWSDLTIPRLPCATVALISTKLAARASSAR